jgi:hypothetical protein
MKIDILMASVETTTVPKKYKYHFESDFELCTYNDVSFLYHCSCYIFKRNTNCVHVEDIKYINACIVDSSQQDNQDSQEDNQEDNQQDSQEDNQEDSQEDSQEVNQEDNQQDSQEDNQEDSQEDSQEVNQEDSQEAGKLSYIEFFKTYEIDVKVFVKIKAAAYIDPTTIDPTTIEPTTIDPTTIDPTTIEPTTIEPIIFVNSYNLRSKTLSKFSL